MWGSNSWPQDQGLHALLTEQARSPQFILLLNYETRTTEGWLPGQIGGSNPGPRSSSMELCLTALLANIKEMAGRSQRWEQIHYRRVGDRRLGCHLPRNWSSSRVRIWDQFISPELRLPWSESSTHRTCPFDWRSVILSMCLLSVFPTGI